MFGNRQNLQVLDSVVPFVFVPVVDVLVRPQLPAKVLLHHLPVLCPMGGLDVPAARPKAAIKALPAAKPVPLPLRMKCFLALFADLFHHDSCPHVESPWARDNSRHA